MSAAVSTGTVGGAIVATTVAAPILAGAAMCVSIYHGVKALGKLLEGTEKDFSIEAQKYWGKHRQPLKAEESLLLCSAPRLKQNFQLQFQQHYQACLEQTILPLEANKVAFTLSCQTLPTCSIPEIGFLENSQTILNAQNTTILQSNMSNLLDNVSQQQNIILGNTLTLAANNASKAIGFTDITEQKTEDMVRVIAKNDKRQVVVTEIKKNPDGEFYIEAETLNIYDNSCHELLEQYDEALRKQGLKYGKTQKKPTGNTPYLKVAQSILQKITPPNQRKQANRQSTQQRQRHHQQTITKKITSK